MKTNELMIGNWYKWYADGEYYNYQVTKDTFKLSDDAISNFEPILITPEILEKNGFESIYEDKTAYKLIIESEYDYATVICIDFKFEEDCYIKNRNDRISYDGKIEYVHELQQLIHRCKVNKEIIV